MLIVKARGPAPNRATGVANRYPRRWTVLMITCRPDGTSDLAHAARERIIGDDGVRPDRTDQLLLGHKAVSVFNQIAQNAEALGAQLNLAIGGSQGAPLDVQGMELSPNLGDGRGQAAAA